MAKLNRENYILGGKVFDTQKAAQEHARAILNRVRLGDRLEEEDALFVQDLLFLHPEREEKLAGHRADYFFVRKHPEWPNRNFMVMRSDGQAVHFSYRYALQPMPRRLWFGLAARSIVEPQKRAYRDGYFATYADASGRAPCELTGERVLPNESDVHHSGEMEFRHIVKSFLEERGIDPETIEYTGTTGGAAILSVADKQLSEEFARYHAEKAVLKVVSRTGHRTLPRQPARQCRRRDEQRSGY